MTFLKRGYRPGVFGEIVRAKRTEPIKCDSKLHSYFKFSRLLAGLLQFTSLRARLEYARASE